MEEKTKEKNKEVMAQMIAALCGVTLHRHHSAYAMKWPMHFSKFLLCGPLVGFLNWTQEMRTIGQRDSGNKYYMHGWKILEEICKGHFWACVG